MCICVSGVLLYAHTDRDSFDGVSADEDDGDGQGDANAETWREEPGQMARGVGGGTNKQRGEQ